MSRWLIASLFLFSSVALANPGVKKDTDIGKRKSKKHYQVTRCVEDKCEVYEVTEFDRKAEMNGQYSAQCFFIIEDKKRFMACNKDVKPQEPKVVMVKSEPIVVEKIVVKTVEKKVVVEKQIEPKKNRLIGKVGYGTRGIEYDNNSAGTKVKEDKGIVLGLGLDRRVTKQMSLGVEIYTNKQVGVTAGFDF